jgi:hypothetical protein
MNKLKVFFSVLLSMILFSSVYVYAENITKMIQVTYRNISILVNGKQIQSDKEPFIFQGSVFVPIRTIGEAVNKKVEWDNEKNKINIFEPTSEFVRLNSFYDLLNFMPDNYQYHQSKDELSIDEKHNLEKVLKNCECFVNPDFEKPLKSYRLTDGHETIAVIVFHQGICIRYSDNSLYCMVEKSQNHLCISTDGWKIELFSNLKNQSDEEFYFLDYLGKVNYSILKDKPNRTKQITDLFAIFLWVFKL